jgi:hypothetical protein
VLSASDAPVLFGCSVFMVLSSLFVLCPLRRQDLADFVGLIDAGPTGR